MITMKWTPDTAFVHGLDVFDGVVATVPATGWHRPTPCAGWRLLDVLGHLGQGVGYGTALLRGTAGPWAPVDPPGAAVTGDPGTWWAALSADARHAVNGVDLTRVVEGPMGPRTVADGLGFPALDLFVHAWDLAAALGHDLDLPDAAIGFAHGVLAHVPPERLRSAPVFGPEADVPDDATPTQLFVAWTGRDPQWQAPA